MKHLKLKKILDIFVVLFYIDCEPLLRSCYGNSYYWLDERGICSFPKRDFPLLQKPDHSHLHFRD